jgi:hypothetical protein
MANIRLVLAAAIAVLTAAAPSAWAQQRIAVPLSDPSRPAVLEVKLVSGDVAVTGYDGDEIVVLVRDDNDDDDDDGDRGRTRDGLRRIPNTSLGLTAEERGNTVAIQVDMTSRNVELEISVPRRTSVHAATVNGGDVTVTGVTGEHELSNVNGDVIAIDIAGAAVIGTTNGDINVSFAEVAANKPMSFSSFNGDVDVTLPANLSANMHVSSAQGDVFTDFDVELQPQPAVVERGGDTSGRYQVRMQRGMRAVVGGGGSEIRFSTFNGDIMIRKR